MCIKCNKYHLFNTTLRTQTWVEIIHITGINSEGVEDVVEDMS
jgi:hypothetical protein